MDDTRTETARRTDEKDLIEGQDDAPAFSGISGGNLQRDIGSRDEVQHEELGGDGVTRVRDKDKGEEANLPRCNEK